MIKAEGVARGVALTADAATVVVAVVLGIGLLKGLAPSSVQRGQSLVEGTTLDLPELSPTQPAIVLFLRKDCRHCVESMPFYRQLMVATKAKGIPIVAVLPPRDLPTGIDLDMPVTSHPDYRSLGVTGTPMIIVVGSNRRVRRIYRGRVPTHMEAATLQDVIRIAAGDKPAGDNERRETAHEER